MSEATAVDHITVRKVHPERAIAARQSDAYHRRASRVYLVSKQEEHRLPELIFKLEQDIKLSREI